MPSSSYSEGQEISRRQTTNYGSFRDGRSQAIQIGTIPESASRSSWASSYSRAVSFQFFRDRVPSVQWEDQIPTDDIEADFTETEYNEVSDEEIDQLEQYQESDELIVKVISSPKSTFSQSLFNSVNILMGIGLLSLPFAFNITGWAVGLGLLGLFALMTHHTARLLQKCLDYRKSDGSVCNTFGDLGETAFGPIGRTGISFIFFFELVAACIALVILSADSIVALFPTLDIVWVKICIVLFVFPLTIPKSLSIASYGSLLGILALFNLMGILIYDGLTKYEAPGSIWEPANTSVMPVDWYPVPLAFGLLMAGFAGHSVFPNLYRDMAKPTRYSSLVNWTYLIIIALYAVIGSLGYQMFGDQIREEITQNLPMIESYNPVLTKLTVGLVAINPITKFPLNMNPINYHLDEIFLKFLPNASEKASRVIVCAISATVVLFVSIKFPGFHSMMALLGSFFSFTVSVIFPEVCYLVLYGKDISVFQYAIEVVIALLGVFFALIGTVWVFVG